MVIELVWDDDCPNVDAARASLAEALRRVGREPRWQEWRRDDPAAPEHARRFGSPAVLIDGADVEGLAELSPCCRVYVDEHGKRSGAPRVETIVKALERAR